MLLVLLLLLIAVWIFIETPWGQNLIITQVTKHFSKELKTKVQIKHVDLSLFNRMHIEGVLVEDHQKDTLLYAGDIKVRITDWFFFKDKIELKYIGLDDAVIKLQRTDSTWNYQFLADYFSSSSSDTSSKGGVEINLKELELHNISLLQKDAWVGQDMYAKIGSLKLDAKEISFSSKKVNIASLDLDKPFFSIYQYDGNRPERPDSSSEAVSVPEKSDSTLQWNTGGWSLQVDKLTINDGRFKD
ncbi:MAG: hypothetical protein JSU05_14280, partial [Bacteroidetes bacterium]|nr:hypothetical protein [Bacteroidota bacterium]